MADQFTRVTKTSYTSRVGNSFKATVSGIVLFLAAFPLLYWNEGRAVQTYKSLKEGASNVVSVSAEKADAANEGKLVHVTGTADTQDVLTDPLFGLSQKAIALERNVEMYQWQETSSSKKEQKLGGGEETKTTYEYKKVWSATPIDSSKFQVLQGHSNPSMAYKSDGWRAKNVSLGDFHLSEEQIKRISNSEELSVKEIPSGAQSRYPGLRIDGKGLYLSASAPAASTDAPLYPGVDTPVTTPTNTEPQVGDYRITYRQVLPQTISIVAKQKGQTFEPYVAQAGGEVSLLQAGEHSAANMFQNAQASNKILTWVIRFFGFFMMYIGMKSVVSPLPTTASVLPFLGTLVGMGSGLAAFLVAAICASLTIAIAWIISRPLIGIGLLAVTRGLVVFLVSAAKKKKAAAA